MSKTIYFSLLLLSNLACYAMEIEKVNQPLFLNDLARYATETTGANQEVVQGLILAFNAWKEHKQIQEGNPTVDKYLYALLFTGADAPKTELEKERKVEQISSLANILIPEYPCWKEYFQALSQADGSKLDSPETIIELALASKIAVVNRLIIVVGFLRGEIVANMQQVIWKKEIELLKLRIQKTDNWDLLTVIAQSLPFIQTKINILKEEFACLSQPEHLMATVTRQVNKFVEIQQQLNDLHSSRSSFESACNSTVAAVKQQVDQLSVEKSALEKQLQGECAKSAQKSLEDNNEIKRLTDLLATSNNQLQGQHQEWSKIHQQWQQREQHLLESVTTATSNLQRLQLQVHEREVLKSQLQEYPLEVPSQVTYLRNFFNYQYETFKDCYLKGGILTHNFRPIKQKLIELIPVLELYEKALIKQRDLVKPILLEHQIQYTNKVIECFQEIRQVLICINDTISAEGAISLENMKTGLQQLQSKMETWDRIEHNIRTGYNMQHWWNKDMK